MKIHIVRNRAHFNNGISLKPFDVSAVSSLQPFVDNIHSLIGGTHSGYHILRIIEGNKVVHVDGTKDIVNWDQVDSTLWNNLKNELLAL
jgi:hypothetical protein